MNLNRETYRGILLSLKNPGNLIEELRRASDHRSPLLAFSGGTDSLLLLFALAPTRLVTLSVVGGGRDFDRAPDSDRILVDEGMILDMILEHKILLKQFPIYTQQILAVCELFLCRHAASSELPLMTGHGPESIFGGFRRRAIPDMARIDDILDTLFLNVDRLTAVAAAAKCELILPFLEPDVFSSLVGHKRSGLSKEELYSGYLSFLPPKASLQNGSGVQYLFARMAKKNGFRYVKDYFQSLVA